VVKTLLNNQSPGKTVGKKTAGGVVGGSRNGGKTKKPKRGTSGHRSKTPKKKWDGGRESKALKKGGHGTATLTNSKRGEEKVLEKRWVVKNVALKDSGAGQTTSEDN